MSDFLELLSNLSLISNSKKESLKDRIIQIISFLILSGCIVALVMADINWHMVKEHRNLTRVIVTAIVTTVIISVILYKCRILRDIMPVTFILYILSVLMAAFTIVV